MTDLEKQLLLDALVDAVELNSMYYPAPYVLDLMTPEQARLFNQYLQEN